MSRVFNGSSDLITVASSPSLDTIGSTLTLMAWIFVTDTSVSRPILQLRAGQTAGIAEFMYIDGDGQGDDQSLVGFVPAVDALAQSQSTTLSVPKNQWTHVAMTYDDNGDRMVHLYVNAVEVTYVVQNAANGSQVSDSGFPALIGSDEYGDFFEGDIAEVQFYNAVLTGPQIVSAMNAGNPLSANQIDYLHLCGSDSPEPDSSGNGNVGILTGTSAGPDSPVYVCGSPTPSTPTSQVDYPGIYYGASLGVTFSNPDSLDLMQVVNEGGDVVWNLTFDGVSNTSPVSPTPNALIGKFLGSSFVTAFPNTDHFDVLQVVNQGGGIVFHVDYLGNANSD